MKSFLLTTTYTLLTSAGLAAFARWLQPAAFSSLVPTVLFAAAVTAAVVHLWRHE